MKSHQKAYGISDEWLTPPEIIEKLGTFDLDPCSPIDRPWDTAKNHFNIRDDGLKKGWFGRVWLNPPFNKMLRWQWMRKMSEHNNGIMLIPAACETKPFAKYVWGKASGILFLRKRPHFYYINGDRAKANSGCSICLIAYGDKNLTALKHSDLGFVIREVSMTNPSTSL